MLSLNYYFTENGSIRFPKYIDYCRYMNLVRDKKEWTMRDIIVHAFESDLVDEEESVELFSDIFDTMCEEANGREI